MILSKKIRIGWAEDISGIGFKLADEIAVRAGIGSNLITVYEAALFMLCSRPP